MSGIPKCCGEKMEARIETAKFVELWCDICKDVVYVKKSETQKPQLLDD